jgi:hypothetical protein
MPHWGHHDDLVDRIKSLEEQVRRLRTRMPPQRFISYSVSGDLKPMTGGLRWYPLYGGMVQRCTASLGTMPGSGMVTITINKNGAEFATLHIYPGTHFDDTVPDPPEYNAGDYFTVDIEEVGSGDPGADLVVQLGIA